MAEMPPRLAETPAERAGAPPPIELADTPPDSNAPTERSPSYGRVVERPCHACGVPLPSQRSGEFPLVACPACGASTGVMPGRASAGLTVRVFTTDYFARAAAEEAASVFSFRRLRRELVASRASDDLVRRAHRAAQDEARHARLMAALAGASVGRLASIRAVLPTRSSLVDVLKENAAEGCASETLAALVASHQRDAGIDGLSPILRGVVEDETQHAALAWDVWRWGASRVSRHDREGIRRAYEDRVNHLTDLSRVSSVGDSRRHALGLPSRRVGGILARRLFEHLKPPEDCV